MKSLAFTALTVVAVATVAAVPLAQQSRPEGAATAPAGIFLEVAGGDPLKLPSSMTMEVDVQGVGASAATFGIVKPKQIVSHPGAKSSVTVTSAQPSFLFRFGPPVNYRDPQAMMASMSEDGMPMLSTHPKEFMLIMATIVDDTRVFDSKKVTKAKFAIKNIAPREFRVTVTEPLKPGEWAFFLADQRKGGGLPVQIWGFSYSQ